MDATKTTKRLSPGTEVLKMSGAFKGTTSCIKEPITMTVSGQNDQGQLTGSIQLVPLGRPILIAVVGKRS